jgi:hypothetical protein
LRDWKNQVFRVSRLFEAMSCFYSGFFLGALGDSGLLAWLLLAPHVPGMTHCRDWPDSDMPVALRSTHAAAFCYRRGRKGRLAGRGRLAAGSVASW